MKSYKQIHNQLKAKFLFETISQIDNKLTFILWNKTVSIFQEHIWYQLVVEIQDAAFLGEKNYEKV